MELFHGTLIRRTPDGKGAMCIVPETNSARVRLTGMKKRIPRQTGPMNMQPVDRSASMPAPVLPAVLDASGSIASMPKAKSTRTEAVRDAKARITRRNSLRMQRQAQKA